MLTDVFHMKNCAKIKVTFGNKTVDIHMTKTRREGREMKNTVMFGVTQPTHDISHSKFPHWIV